MRSILSSLNEGSFSHKLCKIPTSHVVEVGKPSTPQIFMGCMTGNEELVASLKNIHFYYYCLSLHCNQHRLNQLDQRQHHRRPEAIEKHATSSRLDRDNVCGNE